jgi:orotidine-5'-phosphate decarboxylase
VVDAAVTARHKKKPIVIAVTILTSHTEENLAKQLGITRPLKDEVLHLARMTREGGLDGVVCSPQEIQMLRQEFAGQSPLTGTVPKSGDCPPFIIVTPGIRPAGSEKRDQKRTFGPREAIAAGSDYIVVGRPITAAPNPREAALQIKRYQVP